MDDDRAGVRTLRGHVRRPCAVCSLSRRFPVNGGPAFLLRHLTEWQYVGLTGSHLRPEPRAGRYREGCDQQGYGQADPKSEGRACPARTGRVVVTGSGNRTRAAILSAAVVLKDLTAAVGQKPRPLSQGGLQAFPGMPGPMACSRVPA
jgi:hypothetical protein